MKSNELSNELIKWLPKHKCGLYIEHNAHRDIYQTLQQFIDENEHYDWSDEQEKLLALIRNEIWTIQWYPETPIGFHALAFGSLESMLKFSMGE